ncbi:hypothetical protein [Vombatid gammaherpesvirus 1]|uniref:Uncharacterized protein n=1 Tax=Vombatid gammaherpesvirus 1 TaxID=2052651 RepID=A0A3S8D7M2_9GAMA|nr:hypothetical protein KM710_gp67 [Vombatid gammaherpesvirus 1]AZB49172.1 hypothetical protein [Vombatid gammaherpesvirus 1]
MEDEPWHQLFYPLTPQHEESLYPQSPTLPESDGDLNQLVQDIMMSPNLQAQSHFTEDIDWSQYLDFLQSPLHDQDINMPDTTHTNIETTLENSHYPPELAPMHLNPITTPLTSSSHLDDTAPPHSPSPPILHLPTPEHTSPPLSPPHLSPISIPSTFSMLSSLISPLTPDPPLSEPSSDFTDTMSLPRPPISPLTPDPPLSEPTPELGYTVSPTHLEPPPTPGKIIFHDGTHHGHLGQPGVLKISFNLRSLVWSA